MNKLKAETKRGILEILNRPISVDTEVAEIKKIKLLITELEALETEPEPRFKKDELLIFTDNMENKFIEPFSNLEGNAFCTVNGNFYPHASRFIEWLEFKGLAPELPENAIGWHFKYKDDYIQTTRQDAYQSWDNDRAENKIIEYAFWYKA